MKQAVTIPLSHLLENLSKTIASNCYYPLEYEDCRRVIGSCNGLLCFLDYSFTNNRNQDEIIFWFHIWNPATRIISKKLGSCHQPCKPGKLCFSFGYDNSTRTYNAVVLCSSTSDVKVFRFGDNIWRKISSLTPFDFVDTVGYRYFDQGVYLRGTVDWITVEKCVIISLDLGTETYKKLMPPPGAAVNLVPTIAVLMNCLCFSYYLEETHFVIWQMMEFGVEQSWTQFLKISFQNLQVDKFRCSKYYLFPFCLSENDDTLILASYGEEAILYNLKNNRVKQATGNTILWSYSNDYVESLASIC